MAGNGESQVQITWLGHSMFLVEGDGVSLVTDPYDDRIGYPLHEVEADIVLISHGHGDHSNRELVRGEPIVVTEGKPQTVRGVSLYGVPAWHDANRGAERGGNLVFTWKMGGMDLMHLGDIGHIPDRDLAAHLGSPDLLFIPVGGLFTIDAEAAARVVDLLAPRIVIPMHYKTRDCLLPISGVEEFARYYPEVEVLGREPLLMSKSRLPGRTVVMIMDYA
jgi:L-ascorbate metabolism protein UlaG (beta-lactamase superfamily)